MLDESRAFCSLLHREAANDAGLEGPADQPSARPGNTRERTVPIPETLTPVPGYPQKLVVFKMAASRFWQVRCWVDGRTVRRSTQTQSLRLAQSFARRFYEQLMAQRYAQQMKLNLDGLGDEEGPFDQLRVNGRGKAFDRLRASGLGRPSAISLSRTSPERPMTTAKPKSPLAPWPRKSCSAKKPARGAVSTAWAVGRC